MNARAAVIEAVFDLVAEVGEWSGSPAALYERLTPDPPLHWPRTASAFGKALQGATDDLRALGIAVERSNSAGRLLRIAEVRERPKAKPAPTPTGPLVVVREEAADALQELARFVVARRRDRGDLCPRCGRGTVQPGPEGWCAACVSERRCAEEERKRRAKERKRRWWTDSGPAWRAARQAAAADGGS